MRKLIPYIRTKLMPEDTFPTPTADTSIPSAPTPSSGKKNLAPSIISVLILAIVLLIIFWPQGDKGSVQNTNTTTTSPDNRPVPE